MCVVETIPEGGMNSTKKKKVMSCVSSEPKVLVQSMQAARRKLV